MAYVALKEELQSYWELPAIAHFCSLFRMVFKFSEFDIEALEDAFMADAEDSEKNSHCSLVLDTLICLLRGVSGRREVSVDNYNRYFHRILFNQWELAGVGPNPLGPDVSKANFALLPIYVKVKLVYTLCELRLQKNDVENALKDFSGDSMRVVALGEDRNGVTYWYFYGTRLYVEDPEIKITIPLKKRKKNENRSPGDEEETEEKDEKRVLRSQKKRRRGPARDSWAKKRKRKPTAAKPKPVVEHSLKAESLVDAPPEPEDVQDETSSESRGIDEADNELHENGKWEGEDAKASPNVNSSVISTNHVNEKEELGSDEELANCSDNERTLEKPNLTGSDLGVENSGDQSSLDPAQEVAERHDKSCAEQPTEAPLKTEDESAKKVDNFKPSPTIDVESAPWLDQPQLKPPGRRRWRVKCDKLEDWKMLIESLKDSTLSKEKQLHDLLLGNFLPEIEKFYVQREEEKQQREAEMLRRISERLESKRTLRERPSVNVLRDFISSGDEGDGDSNFSEDRKKQQEAESREMRYRSRAMEKEKQEHLRERAREERARRLMARQQRFDSDLDDKVEGAATCMDDRTLSELDIQLELEFMYGQLEKLIYALKSNADAWPFLEPVTEEIAPDYFEYIKNPMDLSLIETKLISRQYKNRLEFVQDINLMLLNCVEYNGLRNDYTKVAQRLERAFIRLWKRYFPASGVNEEDTSLDCIALLGALDLRIKEKVREEVALTKQMLAPHVAPKPRYVQTSFSDRSGIPSTSYTSPSSYHQRMARNFVRPISISPHTGTVTPSPSYRPIAPRHLLQGVSTTPTRPYVVRATSEGHQIMPRRPPVANSQYAYLLSTHDGHRFVRFQMLEGGQPNDALLKQTNTWLRQHAELLPKTLTTITLIDKDTVGENYRATEFSRGSKRFVINETLSVIFTPVDGETALRKGGIELSGVMSGDATSSSLPSTSSGSKNVVLMASNNARYMGPPTLSAAVPPPDPSVTRALPRVTSKPICSVAPLRSNAEDEWTSPPRLLPACVPPTNSNVAATPKSNAASSSTSAPLTLCDQTIVVLSAKQVIVGDSGCYIVNSAPPPVTTGTPPVGTMAAGNSSARGNGVQIIQVVPAGVIISSTSASSQSATTTTTTTTASGATTPKSLPAARL